MGNGRNGSTTARGYGYDWQKLRTLILARDGHVCRYCGGAATSVDHVVPLVEGGARLDPGNLVACCASCNSRKGGRPMASLQPRTLCPYAGRGAHPAGCTLEHSQNWYACPEHGDDCAEVHGSHR